MLASFALYLITLGSGPQFTIAIVSYHNTLEECEATADRLRRGRSWQRAITECTRTKGA
jgi:hypothetical protein